MCIKETLYKKINRKCHKEYPNQLEATKVLAVLTNLLLIMIINGIKLCYLNKILKDYFIKISVVKEMSKTL